MPQSQGIRFEGKGEGRLLSDGSRGCWGTWGVQGEGCGSNCGWGRGPVLTGYGRLGDDGGLARQGMEKGTKEAPRSRQQGGGML